MRNKRRPAAELVELRRAPQLLGDGHRVDRFAAAVQRERGLVDRAVRGLVEVARLEAGFDRGGDRLPRQHHRAEQRLLGFEVVRRDPARVALPPSCVSERHWLDWLDHSFSPCPSRERQVTVAPRACGWIEAKPCVLCVDDGTSRPHLCGL